MLTTAVDAKAKLEAEGLLVSCNTAHGLWIAAHVRDMGDGVQLSDDACSLTWHTNRWVAVFPAEGLLTYEVPGSLPELVSLITAIYACHRQAGGSLQAAFSQVVGEPEQYLVGRSPARV